LIGEIPFAQHFEFPVMAMEHPLWHPGTGTWNGVAPSSSTGVTLVVTDRGAMQRLQREFHHIAKVLVCG